MPKPDVIGQLEQLKPRLVARAGLVCAVRRYFETHGFIETITPVVIPAPAPEEYIEAPPASDGFLRTSPELQMKALLAAGYERIYQIGPCFREKEFGRRHRPEFTMLEWYQRDADYLKLAEFTRGMLLAAAENRPGGTRLKRHGRTIDLAAPWQYISVREAYRRFADADADAALIDDTFDPLMVEKIEPELGWDAPTILFDYPSVRGSLARNKASDPTLAERWELYIGGLELANAYSELRDAAEQRRRFAAAAAGRQAYGGRPYPEPAEFYAALDYGLPECAGCALGMDRLAMVMTEADDIAEVTFPAATS